MNKETVIELTLPAVSACESVVQSTSIASQFDQECQRTRLECKQTFDPNDPASKAKKGATPNSADINREMCCIDREREQVFDPDNPATKNAANVLPNVPTPERAGIDTEALAKQHEQKVQARKTGDLMIFASFIVPTESFKRTVSQANRAGASVVLRGFKNNSLKDMVLAIKELGEQGGNVLVNPSVLTKYRVKAAPTMVPAKTTTIDQVDNEGCALPDNFVAMAGDVSLDYTLDEIVHCAPQLEAAASRYLRQIRGNQ